MGINDEEKMGSIKSAVDLAIVGDNISDIADFTLEKYEFKNDTTLPSDVREEGVASGAIEKTAHADSGGDVHSGGKDSRRSHQ